MDEPKSFTGTGKIFSGDQLLGEAEYRLDVHQEFLVGRTMEGPYRIPGMKTISGTLRGPFPMGSVLKLVTPNGDTLDFFISGSDGKIAASGPFLTKEGKPVV